MAVTVPLILLSWIRSFKELFFFTATGVIALITAIIIILADGMQNTTEEVVERTPLFLSLESTLHFLGPATFCYTIHYCVLAIGAEGLVCVKNERICYSTVCGGESDTIDDVRCTAKNEIRNDIETIKYNKIGNEIDDENEINDNDNDDNIEDKIGNANENEDGNENGNENNSNVQIHVNGIREGNGLSDDNLGDGDGHVATRIVKEINTVINRDVSREINREINISEEYMIEKNTIISRANSREKKKDKNKDRDKDKDKNDKIKSNNNNNKNNNNGNSNNSNNNSNNNNSNNITGAEIGSIEIDEDSVQILFNEKHNEIKWLGD